MTMHPVTFRWDGEAMVPLARFQTLCDRQFVVGEDYRLIEHEERSAASHSHYFACLNEAWKNLPDAIAMEFPTPEKLRKRALVDAGYYNERRLVLSSPIEARKVAGFMQASDEYAVLSVAGNVVIERVAKSQSVKAMGKKEFQESKDAVLGVLAQMVGVSVDALAKNAGMAA